MCSVTPGNGQLWGGTPLGKKFELFPFISFEDFPYYNVLNTRHTKQHLTYHNYHILYSPLLSTVKVKCHSWYFDNHTKLLLRMKFAYYKARLAEIAAQEVFCHSLTLLQIK